VSERAIDHARRRLLQGAAALAASSPRAAPARALRRGDALTVLPTLAHRATDGGLFVRIEAWVFERERNPTRTRALARALGLDLDELPESDRRRFVQRAALFGADDKDGRQLQAAIAGQQPEPLPPSDDQGRVRASLPCRCAAPAGAWIDWAVLGGARRFESRAQWIGDDGLSIVCDIDDTIKHTQVPDRRQMLLNTFAREFAAVPGMARWLHAVQRADGDAAAVHYVSGSPLQLVPVLGSFLAEASFPAGSLHLRALALTPAALFDGGATTRHKHAEIGQLLADHPRRRFVLVGDSGERDPEIYGEFARNHPQRIAAVLIRDVGTEPASAARYGAAFAGVPAGRWRLFTDPVALPYRFD
jgi:hypothetical protein